MPRYEFSEGSSNKFWEITLSGKSFTCRFGKLGASGQTTLKEFASEPAAKTAYDKLIAEKTKKGYTPANGASKKTASAKPAKANAAPKSAAKSAGQYFEFKDGSSSKCWEITLAGKSFTTRFGKIGTDGQTSSKGFKTDGEAKAEYARLVAEKTRKGYKLVRGDAPAAPQVTHAQNPKLEAAIASDPDSPDAYLVYADWLQSQGDPRGELIVLQHANKTAAAKKLLEQNREHFWGKLADFTDILEAYPYRPLGRTTTWRWGYLEALWISNKHERDRMYGEGKPAIDVDEALGWMLDHPSARFLRELTVGIISYESNGYDDTAKVIGKRSLPTLRKLILGDFYSEETELNWSDAGSLQAIYKAVPNLESLTVRSGSMKLGKLELPELRELNVITGGFDAGSLASVCAARWPVLERLSLELGQENNIKLKHLQPIFDGKAFPRVKHLGLGNSEISDVICEGLASSRIAAQLESLDLSRGRMGDAGALALASGKFPKLQTLDVSESWIGKQGLAALKGIAKKLEAKGQQDDGGDPEDRYISGYE